MEFTERKITGVFEIRLKPFIDQRGFFMRTYSDAIFEEHGLKRQWVQDNHSLSLKKGTIRGLHFQLPPYAETKLVRCIRGSVLDVFVDIREDSSTFGQWDSILLSAENMVMIFIPRGFAHGFCSLSENCEVAYKVDNNYSPENERGLIWNDPDLNIEWPVSDPVLSQKDANNLTLKQYLQSIK